MNNINDKAKINNNYVIHKLFITYVNDYLC